jgi:hypothetical protein
LTRCKRHDDRLVRTGRPDDVQLAGPNNQERRDLLPCFDEHFALLHRAQAPAGGDTRHLCGRELREHAAIRLRGESRLDCFGRVAHGETLVEKAEPDIRANTPDAS